jgi:putative membrane protein
VKLLSEILIGLVALEYLYILWLEMFSWTTRAPKVFKSFPKELFPQTTSLAANQGLYNGFLSAGLIWSLLITDDVWSRHVATFFLGCVIVAGVYGAFTADKKIFFVQAFPALIALAVCYFCK